MIQPSSVNDLIYYVGDAAMYEMVPPFTESEGTCGSFDYTASLIDGTALDTSVF